MIINSIDPANSKLDIEILVDGTDEQIAELSKLIVAGIPQSSAPPVIESHDPVNSLSRRIMFSIKGPTDFQVATTLDWLKSLKLVGGHAYGTISRLNP